MCNIGELRILWLLERLAIDIVINVSVRVSVNVLLVVQDIFWEETLVLLNVHDSQSHQHKNVLIHAQTNTSTTHLMTFVNHVLMDVHYVQVNHIVYCGKTNLLILTIVCFMTKCNYGSLWLLLLSGWLGLLFGNLL